MILEFDLGNSRIKWRRLAAEGGAVTGQGSVADLQALQVVLIDQAPPRLVRLCSVRGDDVVDSLRDWLQSTWQLSPLQAQVTSACAGVSNSYQNPARLGVDRWLAMLAAWQHCQSACVVVDAGTALTLDCLDDAGRHEGGYILPGRRLMAASLEQHTRIRLGTEPAPALHPGHDTDAAVRNGILASQVGLLERLVEEGRSRFAGLRVLLTGGESAALAQSLSGIDAEIHPSLVLDGLAYACPAPEQDTAAGAA